MTKLWLATDVEDDCEIGGLHLFAGNAPPSFDQGQSQTNENCEYLGEVSAASVRGVHPEPGTSVEAVLLLKGGE